MFMFMHGNGKRWAMLPASLAAIAALGAGGTAVMANVTDGFATPANWSLVAANAAVTNGLPMMPSGSDALGLTSDNTNEIAGAWYKTAQNMAASWTATFTWQMSSAANAPGDGFMFAVQDHGLNALGYGGSDKGFVDATGSRSNTIPVNPSFGAGVENYSYTNEVDIGEDGAFLLSGKAAQVSSSTLNLQTDTNPINFTIGYSNSTDVVTISAVDSTNSADSLSTNYTLSSSLASILGQNTAYVGFTGSTGGVSEAQVFTNFNFTTAVPEPASLAVLAVGGGLGLLLIGRRRTSRRKA